MKLKYIFIFISTALFAEQIIFPKNFSKANTLNHVTNSESYLKNRSNTLFSLNENQFGKNLRNEFINSQNNLVNFLVKNNAPINDKFLVDIPLNKNELANGIYMLFAVRSNGVSSVGKIINLN